MSSHNRVGMLEKWTQKFKFTIYSRRKLQQALYMPEYLHRPHSSHACIFETCIKINSLILDTILDNVTLAHDRQCWGKSLCNSNCCGANEGLFVIFSGSRALLTCRSLWFWCCSRKTSSQSFNVCYTKWDGSPLLIIGRQNRFGQSLCKICSYSLSTRQTPATSTPLTCTFYLQCIQGRHFVQQPINTVNL